LITLKIILSSFYCWYDSTAHSYKLFTSVGYRILVNKHVVVCGKGHNQEGLWYVNSDLLSDHPFTLEPVNMDTKT